MGAGGKARKMEQRGSTHGRDGAGQQDVKQRREPESPSRTERSLSVRELSASFHENLVMLRPVKAAPKCRDGGLSGDGVLRDCVERSDEGRGS